MSDSGRQRLDWARDVAGQVGSLLLPQFRRGVRVEAKARGIVTEMDRRAEDLIVAALAESFPGDGLYSEEGAASEARDAEWRWIVDPLDGTTNYVSGLPFFSVSLACVSVEGPVLGVVHAPALRETFWALRDVGAWGPDGRLAVTATQKLEDAVFLVNKAYHPASKMWAVAGDLLGAIRAYRTLGCVSLDLALVAAGRCDGLVLLPAEPWDVAAGLLLVREAGARVGNLTGEPVAIVPGEHPPTGLLAATPALYDPAAALLDPRALLAG
ncbi:MAG: inositol monophosphatase family protein [Actinomycetota bacterium]